MDSWNMKYSVHTPTIEPPNTLDEPNDVTSVAVMTNMMEYVTTHEASSGASPTPIIRICSRKRISLSCTSAFTISTAFQLNTTISMRPMNELMPDANELVTYSGVGMGMAVRLGEMGGGDGAVGVGVGEEARMYVSRNCWKNSCDPRKYTAYVVRSSRHGPMATLPRVSMVPPLPHPLAFSRRE